MGKVPDVGVELGFISVTRGDGQKISRLTCGSEAEKWQRLSVAAKTPWRVGKRPSGRLKMRPRALRWRAGTIV